MSSLAIVRELVKQLLKADADKEELQRIKPEIRRANILKRRNLPDEDDDDPVDAA
jgi:hypothetical protein